MNQDKVLELVKIKGPILPVQISKEINTNVLIASAILGELVSQKKIQFSHTKFGGSPLYYVEGQEEKLQQLYSHLPETEKKSFDLLKEKKILIDKALDPALRVALRQIKDFAILLEINVNGEIQLFWKWYLTSSEDVKVKIQSLLDAQKKDKIPAVEKEIKSETVKQEQQNIKTDITNLIEKKNININRETVEVKYFNKDTLREELREELLKELREELKKEFIIQKPIDKKEQKRLEKEQKKKKEEENDQFLIKIKKYCQQKNIHIIGYEILKKKKDIDLLIKIPSAVGKIDYYCKAKNKKKINDGDLNSAFLKGNQKKLPILFLSTGDLQKKTSEKLDNEFKGISFKKINNT